MSDWTSAPLLFPITGTVNSMGYGTLAGDVVAISRSAANTAGAWPTANLAIYIPFVVETQVTAYKMAFNVGAQAGNYDVGLYDINGNRLVSLGSTAVPAAGLAVADIADTTLTPGTYFMAMNVSTTTTLTIVRSSGPGAQTLQACGVQQQAVGAVALPDPATFANPANAYIPSLSVALKSTI